MLTGQVINKWRSLIKDGDMDALSSLLSDKVIFHSPVVYTPQIGKEVTGKYLAAAFNVLVNDTFNYIREIAWEREAMLEFEVELDGIAINGVDIISWDENNQIVDFKVMIRPLKAINIIHEKMMEELQRSKKK